MNASPPVTPRPAATVLLCRDTPDGIETFMVVRHHQIDFASGALVFPGGKVDKADSDPALRARCEGAESLTDEQLAFVAAVIREAFEEVGVFLVRGAGSAPIISAARLATLECYREPLSKDAVTLLAVLEKEDLILACDQVHPFAHWITPEMMPKRFDTRFFLARAPEDHVALHDGGESVDSVWITPERVCREAKEGKWTVIFPTRLNLELLGDAANVDDAIARARTRQIVSVVPWVEQRQDGQYLCIPAEAGYHISAEKVGPEGLR